MGRARLGLVSPLGVECGVGPRAPQSRRCSTSQVAPGTLTGIEGSRPGSSLSSRPAIAAAAVTSSLAITQASGWSPRLRPAHVKISRHVKSYEGRKEQSSFFDVQCQFCIFPWLPSAAGAAGLACPTDPHQPSDPPILPLRRRLGSTSSRLPRGPRFNLQPATVHLQSSSQGPRIRMPASWRLPCAGAQGTKPVALVPRAFHKDWSPDCSVGNSVPLDGRPGEQPEQVC